MKGVAAAFLECARGEREEGANVLFVFGSTMDSNERLRRCKLQDSAVATAAHRAENQIPVVAQRLRRIHERGPSRAVDGRRRHLGVVPEALPETSEHRRRPLGGALVVVALLLSSGSISLEDRGAAFRRRSRSGSRSGSRLLSSSCCSRLLSSSRCSRSFHVHCCTTCCSRARSSSALHHSKREAIRRR